MRLLHVVLQTHSTVAVSDRTATRAVLRRVLQLNDRKMLALGHVADGQIEALAALSGWPGMETSRKNSQTFGVGR